MTDDVVNHPSHYTQYEGIEIIDLTEQMSFNKGNAVKYICRSGFKPVGDLNKEIEDLEKAKFYITRELERLTLKLGEWEEARDRKFQELKKEFEMGLTSASHVREQLGLSCPPKKVETISQAWVDLADALTANEKKLVEISDRYEKGL